MLAAPVIAQVWGPDAAYWATPARLSEILVGACLAMVLARRTQLPRRTAVLAPIALVALGLSVVLFPAAGGPAYEGALPVIALMSGSLLLGLQVDGPVRAALSLPTLVFVGKISYGVYLYHWPIYVIVDADRLGVDGVPLVLVRLALTFTVAVASYSLFEQPIRHTSRSSFRPTFVGSLTATSVTAVAAVVLVPTALGSYWESDSGAAEAAAIEVDDTPLVPITADQPASTAASPTTIAPSPVAGVPGATAPTSTAPTTTSTASTSSAASPASTAPSTAPTTSTTTVAPIPALARPVRALVVGDSTAEAISSGLIGWAADHPDMAQVESEVERGCGFVVTGDRWTDNSWEAVPSRCAEWMRERVPAQAAELAPDVVVLMVTPWDVIDHRWDDGDGLTPFDAAFAERLAEAYRDVTESLVDAGVGSIVWVDPPVPNPLWISRGKGQADPARYEVVRSIIEGIERDYPQLRTLPFAQWHTGSGLDDDHDIRPDGVHWTPEVSRMIAEGYLGEQVVRAALGLGFS
jgi:hypothetical protein